VKTTNFLLSFLILVAATGVSGCTDAQRAVLQTAIARASPAAPGNQIVVPPLETPNPSATSAFSMLPTPTLPPIAAGPMGTLTAIAGMFASPTPNREPYLIINRGKPHFIEFHAWW